MATLVSMRYAKAASPSSVASASRNVDRLPFFDPRRLWHPAQDLDCILHTVARRKNRDDVTHSRDLEIDVGIRIGKLGRNANGLAIAGFEHAGPRHRSLSRKQMGSSYRKIRPGR